MVKDLGVGTSKLLEAELIKEIQLAEGNYDCFGTAAGYCDQEDPLFQEGCLN